MKNRLIENGMVLLGTAMMVGAALFVDWRLAFFVAGLILWIDFR